MFPIIPSNTIDAPCANCPHKVANANNSDLGQQIMRIIDDMTPAERAQMVTLIDDILTASRQRH